MDGEPPKEEDFSVIPIEERSRHKVRTGSVSGLVGGGRERDRVRNMNMNMNMNMSMFMEEWGTRMQAGDSAHTHHRTGRPACPHTPM
jgi:hypothetical protein